MKPTIIFDSDDSDSDLEIITKILDFESDDDINMPSPQWERSMSDCAHIWEDEEEQSDVSMISSPPVSKYLSKRTNYMQCLNDVEFTFSFRLNKTSTELLLTEIMPYVRVTSKRNNGVSPLHQLLLALRFYALGTMLISVADFVGVSKASASRIVRDISQAIAMLYNKYIMIKQNTQQNFYRMTKFPQVLGVIDCMDVPIQSPCHLIGEEFKNQKGYYSFKVQAVCDADLRLMNVVARWPGSAQDATIFNNSDLKAQCDSGAFGNCWLLGDNAYPNRPYLLTPVVTPVSDREHRYNVAHKKTIECIERTFRAWKCRFPVVALTMRLSLENIQCIIIATAVLHNICQNYNIKDVAPVVELPANEFDDFSQIIFDDVQDIKNRTDLINDYF